MTNNSDKYSRQIPQYLQSALPPCALLKDIGGSLTTRASMLRSGLDPLYLMLLVLAKKLISIQCVLYN